MRIFRCHHKFGFEHGPFTGDYAIIAGLKIVPKIHLCPSEDGMSTRFGAQFGCVDLRSVEIWFGKSIMAIQENGFLISEFEADENDVTVGKMGTQCQFIAHKAKHIRTMTILDCIDELYGFE